MYKAWLVTFRSAGELILELEQVPDSAVVSDWNYGHVEGSYTLTFADKSTGTGNQTDECQHPDSWFSRTLCECDSMHYFCTECGVQMDACRESGDPAPSGAEYRSGPLGDAVRQSNVLAGSTGTGNQTDGGPVMGFGDEWGDGGYRPSATDNVVQPKHYTSHPSGIQPIEITKYESFLRGNVLKYVLRAPYKGNELEDLLKAQQYLQLEIERVLQEESTLALE